MKVLGQGAKLNQKNELRKETEQEDSASGHLLREIGTGDFGCCTARIVLLLVSRMCHLLCCEKQNLTLRSEGWRGGEENHQIDVKFAGRLAAERGGLEGDWRHEGSKGNLMGGAPQL